MKFINQIIHSIGFQGKKTGRTGTLIRDPQAEPALAVDLERSALEPVTRTCEFKVGERILERYEVRAKKQGSFGHVYLCIDQRYQLPVAIKTLKNQNHPGVKFAQLLDKFYLEAQTWVRLEKHPNIVQAKGVEKIEGQPFILLEFVPGDERYGPSLADWLTAQGRLGIPTCINFGIQVCRGMEHANRLFQSMGQLFVHRDIKPDNMMVTQNGVLKITDFGLVKIFNDVQPDIFTGAGTLPYMAPEQFEEDEAVDTRTDIYAVGCLLYAMLAGHPPFVGAHYHEFQYHHQRTPPRPLEHLINLIPPKLSAIVLRCLEKDPDQRYPHFTALKNELGKLYAELMGEPLREESSVELESWERINKGIALCRLGYRQQAVVEYLQAFEADPQAASRLLPADFTHRIQCYCPVRCQTRLIVHIQSIYTNYSQQKKLSSILDLLVSRYGLKLIAVEGGSGKIDLSFYRNLPDKKHKEQVAHDLLKQAKIQGHEYFAITTTEDIAFYGAEQPGLHERHTESLLANLPEMQQWATCCEVVEQALLRLKPHVYNQALLQFEQLKAILENNSSYPAFVKSLLTQFGITDPFPQIDLQIAINQLATAINRDELAREHNALLDFLQQNLISEQLDGLLKMLRDYQRQEMSEQDYYGYLKNFFVNHFPPALLQSYPHLNTHIEMMGKRSQWDAIQFFGFELPEAERRIRERLYDSAVQRELDQYLRVIDLLKKGFEVRLIPDEADYFDANRKSFSSHRMVAFIREQAAIRRLTVTSSAQVGQQAIVVPEQAEQISDHLQGVDSFYSQSRERSRKLIENCLTYMAEEGEPAVVLATGGYHTRFIEEYLKERQIPYLVLSTKVDALEDSQARYFAAIQNAHNTH